MTRPSDADVAQAGRRGRIGRRLVLTFVAFVAAVMGATGWVLYDLTRTSLDRQMSERLVAIAQLVSEGVDGDAVERLRPGYEGGALYGKLTLRLRRARDMVGARRIFVFDRLGRSLLDTEPDVSIGREYVRLGIENRTELASVWAGRAAHSVLFLDADGVHYKSGFAPVLAGDEVVAGVGVEIGAGFLDTERAFLSKALALGAVGAVLTVLVGLGLARTLTRPILRLVQAAREIGSGNMGAPVDTSARDELGYLAETMEEMRRRLLARDEQLRQMLAGVAHEIRNPLGGIEIYAGLIADDLPEEDLRKVHIQKVIGEVQTLNRVISEFLDFARPGVVRPARVDVGEVIEEAVFLLAPEMERAGVRCRKEVRNAPQAYADADHLKRVLINLMKNGVQAMPGGGDLVVRAGRSGHRVVVEVADSGCGIPQEVKTRLFEPFFTTREAGSGLGLAIVHKLVEENGGHIQVTTEVGQGATFRMAFPVAQMG